MPDRISPSPDSRRSSLRFLALGAVAAIALSTSRQGSLHAELVAVDHVPPDACVAFYGPGPCREHGQTIIGSTDAVAGPPPESWRGKVEVRARARL